MDDGSPSVSDDGGFRFLLYKKIKEKDENGLYGRTLETEHFIKIGPRKEHNQLDVQIERTCVSDFQNIEELELLQDGETFYEWRY